MKKVGITALGLAFWAFSLYAVAPPADAKNKAVITDAGVGREGEYLNVSFRIQKCFTPKMEEAIRSGVSTSFRILIVLEKTGMPLFRPRLVDFSLEHTIKYDRLRNEYRLTLPEHPEGIVVTKDFEEAKLLMSRIVDAPVVPLRRLQKKDTYQLRIKVELSKIRLPPFFRYIFFFVSLWDFETDWVKMPVIP